MAYGAAARWGKVALITLCAGVGAPGMAAAQGAAEATTIVAMGDSLTQGFGLMEADGLVPQLQAWLTERGHEVRLENHGVSGDTTAGGLARVDWALGPHVDAMILTLGGNDLLRGLPPEVTRANLDGILSAAAAREIDVLLVGLAAPANYGAEYQQAFDAIYPDLAATYDTLLITDFLGALTEATGGDLQAALSTYMQPDGIHPNAAGVAVLVEAMGPTVEALLTRVGGGV